MIRECRYITGDSAQRRTGDTASLRETIPVKIFSARKQICEE